MEIDVALGKGLNLVDNPQLRLRRATTAASNQHSTFANDSKDDNVVKDAGGRKSEPDLQAVAKTLEQLDSPYNRTVGFLSGQGRYLTAEGFGHKINVTGTILKKKQCWTLIPEISTTTTSSSNLNINTNNNNSNSALNVVSTSLINNNQIVFGKCRISSSFSNGVLSDPNYSAEYPVFYLMSCMNRFLGMDRHGNVYCESELTGPEQRFALVFVISSPSSDNNMPQLNGDGDEDAAAKRNKAQTWGSFHLYNVSHGYYLSASASTNLIKGVNKPNSPAEYWSLHLQIHPPYVNLKHVHRGKYVKTCKQTSSRLSTSVSNTSHHVASHHQPKISCRSVCHLSDALPWGIEALFTIETVCPSDIITAASGSKLLSQQEGRVTNHKSPVKMIGNSSTGNLTMYTIKTHDGLYLTSSGTCQSLIPNPDRQKIPDDAFFYVQIIQGHLAFRDNEGRYLTAIGNEGIVKCKKTNPSKDELWAVTGSSPQISFKGMANDKFVSAQRGIDLALNQDEATEFETFQLENDPSGKYWCFKTVGNKYWALADNACIVCVDKESPLKTSSRDILNEKHSTYFVMDWLPNKCVAIKSVHNNKYLTMKINKQLFATAHDIGEREMLKLYLVNRPFVFLQGSDGYVGEGKSKEGPIDVTKINYEETYLEQISNCTFHFKTISNMYWSIQPTSNLIIATLKDEIKDGVPDIFHIIFVESSKVLIETANGKYLKIGPGKRLEANEDDKLKATIWNI